MRELIIEWNTGKQAYAKLGGIKKHAINALKEHFPFRDLESDAEYETPGLTGMLKQLTKDLESRATNEKAIIMLLIDFSLQAEKDTEFAALIREKYEPVLKEPTPELTTHILKFKWYRSPKVRVHFLKYRH